MSINVTVDITPESLRKAIQDVARYNLATKSKVARAVQVTAVNVQRGAKKAAPVDTGRLRSSVGLDVQDAGLTAEVGTGVEYAGFVEFGTSKMKSQPFLFPAAEAERQPFFQRVRKALKP